MKKKTTELEFLTGTCIVDSIKYEFNTSDAECLKECKECPFIEQCDTARLLEKNVLESLSEDQLMELLYDLIGTESEYRSLAIAIYDRKYFY